ncbi:MAG: Rpn family recombination-promoting nuclease/putative transposase [Treponema sp.]|nr:Rpn family recombination-promoting nuclease/putative transposase [Treponema sp.]
MPGIKKYPAWEELTFANNFLFCKILESDPELCRQLLEMLLHVRIEKLSSPKSEWTMQEGLDAKSVRFDVYTKDENRIFDIEIQTTNQKNLPKRARYYQCIIDMDNLSHGEKYSRLKDSYVIFLCLEAPFKKRLPVYFFENTCRGDDKIKLNDGAYKVFFNASDYAKMESDEEKNFFKFLAGHEAENELTKSIEEKVIFARKNMEWRKQYMTWQQTIDEEKDIAFEEGVRQGLEQGIAQGLVRGMEQGVYKKSVEDAKAMLADGMDVNLVAKYTGLPLETIESELC